MIDVLSKYSIQLMLQVMLLSSPFMKGICSVLCLLPNIKFVHKLRAMFSNPIAVLSTEVRKSCVAIPVIVLDLVLGLVLTG